MVVGQEATQQKLLQHELDALEYEELLTLFDQYPNDSISMEKIARTYLDRARLDEDTIKMARGYDRLAQSNGSETNLIYADSLISLTKNLSHITYPGLGYIIKAHILSSLGKHKESVEYYLESYKIAQSNDNVNHKLYILSVLFTEKNRWGNKQESFKILEAYEKILNQEDFKEKLKNSFRNTKRNDFYLNKEYTLFKLYNNCDYIDGYLSINQPDSAELYHVKNIALQNQIDDNLKSSLSKINTASRLAIDFSRGKYRRVIRVIDSLHRDIIIYPDTYLSKFLFKKGISYYKLGLIDKSIKCLKKADSLNSINFILPQDRVAYDLLTMHFEKINDLEKVNYFFKRKHKIDSIFKENYKSIDADIIKYIETPILIDKKDSEISFLQRKNTRIANRGWWISLGILGLMGSILVVNHRRQKTFLKRFHSLEAERIQNKQEDSERFKNSYSQEISSKIVDEILTKLGLFEKKRNYLNSETSLQKVAKDFNTNTNYLSRVVNLKIGKGFSQYINDLRLDYAINILLTQSKYRKFTIKAIAEECGYSNADSFSRAFYKRFKIYPSYYIKRLEMKK